MRQEIEKVLKAAGLYVKEEDCSGYGGGGVRLSVSGLCAGGVDDFSVTTLPYGSRGEAEKALEDALVAFVSPGVFPDQGVPGLWPAASAEELFLKAEVRG